jgi:2-polyprenyl-3-methyl-5-hydroxy-6-metoxy-1,4-benzoquinol methylase
MGKEQPASYYDQVYAKSQEYSKPWQNSRYVKVWERMVQRFDKEVTVIDLGCGVGQCAEYLNSVGFTDYIGVDFSFEAIKKAVETNLNPNDYMFWQSDLLEFINAEYLPQLDGNHQFFLSEVLEHIENDEEILAVLSQKFTGSRISLSVPTFDDKSHVRHFKSTISVKERYSPLIDIQDLSQIGPWIIVQGRLK